MNAKILMMTIFPAMLLIASVSIINADDPPPVEAPAIETVPSDPPAVPAPTQTATSTSMSLTLQDALTRVLNNNPLVKIERLNTDIAASIVRDNSAAAYDPRLRLSYGTSDRARPTPRPFSESHDLSLSITESLPTGTDIELSTGASPYASAQNPNNKYQNSIGITVTQALLQGFGASSSSMVTLRKSKIDLSIRQEELTAYAQRLLSDTERAYWELLLSGEQMAIYEYSLELAQRLLYESEERLKIGGIAPIDLVAIRAEVASRERQLFDAQTSYSQKSLTLKYLMNAPDLYETNLSLADSAATLGAADGVDDHIEAAKMFRPDYLQAYMQAQKGELDLVQTKNGLLPRLDFYASLSAASPAESFGTALTPNGDASSVTAIGLTLQLPITNKSARERHARTAFSVEQQRISIENYARLIDYEIRSAHMEVYRASRQIESAKTVSALQLQKLEAEQEKMNAGKSTGYAVLQVQRDLVSASLDEAQARTAYVSALISLYTKDGTFLQRRGVKM